MDLKKVIRVFILIFILIDLFLGGQIVQRTIQNRHNEGAGATLSNMDLDNISYGKLSQTRSVGDYLGGNYDLATWAVSQARQGLTAVKTVNHTDKQILTAELRQPRQLSKNVLQQRQQLKSILEDPKYFIHGDQYVYNENVTHILNQNKNFDMILCFQQKLLQDDQTMGSVGRLELILNQKHQLVGYRQSYVKNVQKLRNPVETISQEAAVIALYQNNELPNGSKIIWSQLNYGRLMVVNHDVVMVPIWFVAVQNGAKQTVLKVNAIDGKLIK